MSDKEDPVTKDHQLMLRMFAVGVVVLLFAISVCGVRNEANPLEHHDAWVRYVSHYQTLIGGFLAVAAAYITVRQMRKTDERADIRHRDLLRLQMRETYNEVSFINAVTLNYFDKKMNEVADSIASYKSLITTVRNLKIKHRASGDAPIFRLPDNVDADIRKVGSRIKVRAHDLQKYLTSGDLVDRKHHLDVKTRVILDELELELHQIFNKKQKNLNAAIEEVLRSSTQIDDENYIHAKRIESNLDRLRTSLLEHEQYLIREYRFE